MVQVQLYTMMMLRHRRNGVVWWMEATRTLLKSIPGINRKSFLTTIHQKHRFGFFPFLFVLVVVVESSNARVDATFVQLQSELLCSPIYRNFHSTFLLSKSKHNRRHNMHSIRQIRSGNIMGNRQKNESATGDGGIYFNGKKEKYSWATYCRNIGKKSHTMWESRNRNSQKSRRIHGESLEL